MKTATGFEHGVSEASFPTPDFIFNNAIAFDPTNSVFNPHPKSRYPLIDVFVQVGQSLTPRLLFRLQDGHIGQVKALKTGILD